MFPINRHAPRIFIVAATVFALVSVPRLFLSCHAETAGENITVEVAFAGATAAGGAPTSFTTEEGYEVELTSALILVGPLYFYGGEPREQLVSWDRLLPGVARACPTHAQFDSGRVLAEVLHQEVADLLAPAPTSLGLVRGAAGTVASAEVHLHPPGRLEAGPSLEALAALGGATLSIAGNAGKGEWSEAFVAHLTIPDEGLMRIVEGIPASVALADNSKVSGMLTVEALPDRWLNRVRFDTLHETDDQGRLLFTPGTQAFSALLQGVRMRDAYRVVWRD